MVIIVKTGKAEISLSDHVKKTSNPDYSTEKLKIDI
jgi:hypothetical protein